MSIEIIQNNNISKAWAATFLKSYDMPFNSSNTIITVINSFEDTKELEDQAIKELLDCKLKSYGLEPIENTAFTIFPKSYWNKNKDMYFLFRRFLRIYPLLKKYRKNRLGTYFHRMINYYEDVSIRGNNQLEHVINTYKMGNHRHSALQAIIFSPNKDHCDAQRRDFPCLHQVSFTPLEINGIIGLSVCSYYPTQLIFERAYGNYLGLFHLGIFMAKEMGIKLFEVKNIAIKAKLSFHTKTELKDLYLKLK